VSPFHETVIPGEPKDYGRDPESRELAENHFILDPGSHPASVFAEISPDSPRHLAGMTGCPNASGAGVSRTARKAAISYDSYSSTGANPLRIVFSAMVRGIMNWDK
jgi:hypothetical protein